MSSAMNVPLGMRKLLSASVTGMDRLLPEDEDEQRHEGEVDEVHGLDQADGQEEEGGQPTLRLRLAGDARDQVPTGHAVTDGGADGAAAERETTADEGARGLDGRGVVSGCQLLSPPVAAPAGGTSERARNGGAMCARRNGDLAATRADEPRGRLACRRWLRPGARSWRRSRSTGSSAGRR